MVARHNTMGLTRYALCNIHCNLVITLILGFKQNDRYNETSVIMKCTFRMA